MPDVFVMLMCKHECYMYFQNSANVVVFLLCTLYVKFICVSWNVFLLRLAKRLQPAKQFKQKT